MEAAQSVIEGFGAEEVDRDFLKSLSRETGTPLPDLVALSSQFDPFLAGSPAQNRDATWFVAVTSEQNRDTHLRDLNYVLVGDDSVSYDGTEAEWRRLQRGAGLARDMGLVEPWAFPDMRTSELLRNRRGDGEEIEYVVTKPTFYVPTQATVTAAEVEDFDALHVQPVRVIVTMEKDSENLRAEVVRPCVEAGAELRVTIGNSPKTLAARLCREAREDGRPLVVFTITDADSSGEHMAVITARHIEFIRSRYPDIPPVYVARIALTLEQVREIEAEIGRTIPLAPDVRREIGRVELNALPVFAPGWLRRQVETELASVTVEVAQPETGLPEELELALNQAQGLARRLYRRIEDKLRWIEEIVDATIEEWKPDAVDFDSPTVANLDLDRDWILDPGRDYLAQLNAYRRHGAAHRDQSALVLAEERLCGCGCGESIGHMSVQARYLNAAHRSRARRRRA